MLVLTRRAGQRIFLDDNIIITVIETKSNHVRIGIEAPASVHIVREEISEQETQEGEG